MEDFDIADVYKRSVHGVIALISRSFFLNVISYIASLLIFSYLLPSEVGIYIAVTSIQRIIGFITDFGFGAALIQKKEEITQADIRTTFTLQMIVTGCLFVGVLLLHSVIASYFSFDVKAMQLLFVLVFTIFLSSFKVIPSILLERNIQFHKLILPQIVESLLFNILLILLVINGLGITSYTWAFLISSIASIPFYYYVSPWKLQLGIDKASLHHLHYGLQFQAKNILATIKDDFLTVFLVKILSFQDLGYIGFGQRNAFFAYRYIVDNVTKVTFSTYARVQEESGLLRKTIERSLFYVSACMFPFVFGVIVVAPYIVQYVPRWQNKWEPAIISLIFFSLNALVSSLSGILVNVLDATGRVKTTLRLMVLWTIGTWGLTWLFISLYGYNGVSIASFLVTLTIVLTVIIVKRIVSFSFLGSIYKPFIASLVMGMVTYVGTFFVANVMQFVLLIAVGVVTYVASMYMLAKEELYNLVRLLKR